jgi:tetratricopeptide (TPR) repeat protein
MRRFATIASSIAIIWSAPVWAGEEPIYQPAPDWVQPAELPAARSGPPLVLLDEQRRIEGNRVWSYSDRAFRIDNPQVLQGAGTIQAQWMPDKGDLIVHRVTIVRDGEEIDVLNEGARFDVLRREQQLEQRTIDGALTATLAVPGLRVGDVLRMVYSVTLADQALKDNAQSVVPLVAKPLDVGFARVIVSWPQSQQVAWKGVNLSGGALPEPTVQGGFETLTIPLPLAKPAEMPGDAPARYRLPALLQVGTFSGWQDVSRAMAPLFATEGTIAPGGPIAALVKTIEAGAPGQLDRALAALQLVQDQVSYLANGMDGGNYIPQTPAETWQKRYGDCKAKTLLLLAMLREMGIEAEPFTVLANGGGDAIPTMLPLPADFNHIIVRAVIDGTEYWLDGTDTGASMAVIGSVPPFAYGLPLRPEGADLMPLRPRSLDGFDAVLALQLDETAGADLPTLFTAEWTLRGSAGGMVRAVSSQASKDVRENFVSSLVNRALGNHWLTDSSLSYDEQSNVATIKASGMTGGQWSWDHGRFTAALSLPSMDFQFKPDRSRSEWRDIPVALPGPQSMQTRLTVLLPDADGAYRLDGHADVDETIANVRLRRTAKIDGGRLTATDSIAWPGGEVPPAQVAEAKAGAARLGSLDLGLRGPNGLSRRFRFAEGADRSVLKPIEQAYAQLIADDPDDIERVSDRARFRASSFDRKGAIDDLGKVISERPSANAYQRRARLLLDMGDLDGALADAKAASGLEPGLGTAALEAEMLAYAGKGDEAFELLSSQGGSADQQRDVALQLSDLDALAGRPQDGLERLSDLLDQRPGDPDLLNANCYFRATWQVELEGLVDLCSEAVTQSNWAAPVLDSRALGYYRLGEFDKAMKDLDAALSANPEQTPSLYLRGVVRTAMGDAGGREDIRQALLRQPSLERFYARFGITAR